MTTPLFLVTAGETLQSMCLSSSSLCWPVIHVHLTKIRKAISINSTSVFRAGVGEYWFWNFFFVVFPLVCSGWTDDGAYYVPKTMQYYLVLTCRRPFLLCCVFARPVEIHMKFERKSIDSFVHEHKNVYCLRPFTWICGYLCPCSRHFSPSWLPVSCSSVSARWPGPRWGSPPPVAWLSEEPSSDPSPSPSPRPQTAGGRGGSLRAGSPQWACCADSMGTCPPSP